MFGYLKSKYIKDLWPRPPLGLDAVADSLNPLPVPGLERPAVGQSVHSARRGVADQGEYASQTYNVGPDRIMNRSLARSMIYTWQSAQFDVGGPTYPQDFGFGPGAHYDAMTPQFYMRPGIPQRRSTGSQM